jgi:hypothetical protein
MDHMKLAGGEGGGAKGGGGGEGGQPPHACCCALQLHPADRVHCALSCCARHIARSVGGQCGNGAGTQPTPTARTPTCSRAPTEHVVWEADHQLAGAVQRLGLGAGEVCDPVQEVERDVLRLAPLGGFLEGREHGLGRRLCLHEPAVVEVHLALRRGKAIKASEALALARVVHASGDWVRRSKEPVRKAGRCARQSSGRQSSARAARSPRSPWRLSARPTRVHQPPAGTALSAAPPSAY